MNSKNESGIALIQVLLITAILSILALFFLKTSNSHVDLARISNDRTTAYLNILSAKNELMFALLTEFRVPSPQSPSKYVRKWNFYDVPFQVSDNVKIAIQDHAGLLNIYFLDEVIFSNMLKQLGFTMGQSRVIINSLLDWQDYDDLTRIDGAESASYQVGPRNGNVTNLDELRLVNGVSSLIWNKIKDSLTVYRRSPFNPMNSTPEILSGILGKNRALEYIKLRESTLVSPSDFEQLTGLSENIEQVFYPGNVLEISLESQVGEVRLTNKILVEVDPYADYGKIPVNYLQVKW